MDMNSFLKGFLSLFDWMFPRNLEEQMEDLDFKMQELYDKMGWGKYPYSHKKNLKSVEDNPINESCKPYVEYYFDDDTFHVFWDCNVDFYVEPVKENLNIELFKEFDTDRIVGVKILNVKNIMQSKL